MRARGPAAWLLCVSLSSCDAAGVITETDPGFGPADLMPHVEEDRYGGELSYVAAERAPETVHWQAVQDRCALRFEAAGFIVERHTYDTGVNVIGVLPGGDLAAEQVVISAHYDHVAGCQGADDNASGVAGVFESARVLGQHSYRRTLVVACWDEEERGLIGSGAWVERAVSRADVITASFVYEMIGAFDDRPDTQELPPGLELVFEEESTDLLENQSRGDFLALVFDEAGSQAAADDIVLFGGQIGLKVVALGLSELQIGSPLLGDLYRSDHARFWEAGLPGMQITDTSEYRYPQYHCRDGDDVVENLDLGFATQIVRATTAAAAAALELQPE